MYDYRCERCSTQFEIRQSFSDEALTVCPAEVAPAECVAPGEGPVKKVFSGVAISFKGDGFYKNDHGANAQGRRKERESDSSKDSSTKDSSPFEGLVHQGLIAFEGPVHQGLIVFEGLVEQGLILLGREFRRATSEGWRRHLDAHLVASRALVATRDQPSPPRLRLVASGDRPRRFGASRAQGPSQRPQDRARSFTRRLDVAR